MAEPGWLKIVVDCCAIGGALVGIVTAVLAVSTFRKNAMVKRAEWLKTLHAQFYESDLYRTTRRVLDYKPQPEFDRLKEAVLRGDGTAEAFGLYLNFFEFVASLWKLDQLKLREVKMLFEYYIDIFEREDLGSSRITLRLGDSRTFGT